MKKRVIALLLALVVCTSFMVVSASASYDTTGWGWNRGGVPRGDCFPFGYEDGSSVALISVVINTDPLDSLATAFSALSYTLYGSAGFVNPVESYGWDAYNYIIDRYAVGFCSEEWLTDKYIPYLEEYLTTPISNLNLFNDVGTAWHSPFCFYEVFGFNKPEFSLREDTNGFLRVYDSANGWWVVDSRGQYCFSVDIEDTTYSGSIYTEVALSSRPWNKSSAHTGFMPRKLLYWVTGYAGKFFLFCQNSS